MADRSGGDAMDPLDNQIADEALARAAQRDRSAIAPLYDRYVNRIYRYCLRRLRRVEDAEDATAAIFLRAVEHIEGFRGGSFAAWLFAIARTVVADRARHGSVIVTSIHLLPEPVDVTSERDVTGFEHVSELQWLFDGLTSDQRDVVELRLAGLSGQEIADALSRSVDSVKMLQLRAMKRLRELAVESRHSGDACHE